MGIACRRLLVHRLETRVGLRLDTQVKTEAIKTIISIPIQNVGYYIMHE